MYTWIKKWKGPIMALWQYCILPIPSLSELRLLSLFMILWFLCYAFLLVLCYWFLVFWFFSLYVIYFLKCLRMIHFIDTVFWLLSKEFMTNINKFNILSTSQTTCQNMVRMIISKTIYSWFERIFVNNFFLVFRWD